MTAAEIDREPNRSILHVLPHPGGGGETYVDALSTIEGFRSERTYLAPGVTPDGVRLAIARRALAVQHAARSHTLLHAHGEVASTLCLPALATRPSVVTFNGLHLLRRLHGTKRAAAKANLRLIVRAASTTICVSQAEHDELAEVVSPRLLRKAVLIHNGVAPLELPTPAERAAFRSELGIKETTVVGVFVGSLDNHKDPVTPVRAAVDVARAGGDSALIVVGDGPLRPQVEEAAHAQGGGTIRVLGYRRDVGRILGAADFFVLSSQREGFSFALLEAMSLGLPAVVSDAPGNPEAVGDGGLVVPYGDTASFTAAFAQLTGDAAKRHRLGVRARERVTRSFSVEQMLCRTWAVYDEIIRASR